jgi:hypothetical protein
MTAYRNDLLSAHQRIAELERALREREKTATTGSTDEPVEPGEQRNSTTPAIEPEPFVLSGWHAWPLVPLVALVVVRAVRPSLGGGVEDVLVHPTTITCAIASVVLYLGSTLLKAHAGRSTVLSRIVVAVAIAVGLPWLLPAGIAAMHLGGILMGAIGVVFAVVGGVAFVYRWIAGIE